jgi:hypothetical protein
MTEAQRSAHPNIYKVFFLNEELRKQQRDTRKHGEDLHAYLTRKHITCFCKPCRHSQVQEAAKNQTAIV